MMNGGGEELEDRIQTWIRSEVDKELSLVRQLPSATARFFVDLLCPLSKEERLQFWGELRAVRAGRIQVEQSTYRESLSQLCCPTELTAKWKYMPPVLRKAGARLYGRKDFKPELMGFTRASWSEYLAEKGMTEESLTEATSVKAVSPAKLSRLLISALEDAGWEAENSGVIATLRKRGPREQFVVHLDCGGRWPGFTYSVKIVENEGKEKFRDLSLERLAGISLEPRWDWISEDNAGIAAQTLVVAVDTCLSIALNC